MAARPSKSCSSRRETARDRLSVLLVREPELEVERSSRLSATSLSGFGPSRGEPKSHRGRTEPLVTGRGRGRGRAAMGSGSG